MTGKVELFSPYPPPPSCGAASHEQFVDILTVISVIGVVFLHTNGVFWTHPSGRLWITSNIIESVFYYAVPVFFMVSGYTLMNFRDRYGVGQFFIKRFRRTVVPFFGWSTCIYIALVMFGQVSEDSSFLLSVFNCSHFQIYWFFIPLFACYLSIPVLSLVMEKKTTFFYLAIYAFISYSILPFLASRFNLLINPEIKAPIAGGYVLYLLLGFLAGHYHIKRCYRILIYIAGLVGLLLHCCMTIILSPDGMPINGLYKGYLNFPAVLYSLSVFVFCKYTNWDYLFINRFTNFCLGKLKQSSLGIYLTHGILVYYLVPYSAIPVSSIIYRTVGAVVIILLCSVFTLLLQRIPVVRKLVP